MIFFLIFAQNIVVGTHNLCFGAKNKKKNVYPCKPQFYYIKVGCKGAFVSRTCFRDGLFLSETVTKATCKIRNSSFRNFRFRVLFIKFSSTMQCIHAQYHHMYVYSDGLY